MRFLFVHPNFPGQYLHLVRMLRNNGHEVVFVTRPNENRMRAVRKVDYQVDDEPNPNTYLPARAYESALRRADAVGSVAGQLKAEGFAPDLIIGHHGWGDLLNLQDVWEGVPLLGYLEFYYHARGFETGFDPLMPADPGLASQVRARNAVNHAALINPGWGQTPTEFQLSTYPEVFRNRILLIPEGVDLETCAPDPIARDAPLGLAEMAGDPEIAAGLGDASVLPLDQLITYVNTYLEPVRGMQTMMLALPRLLARPDVRVVVLGTEKRKGYGPQLGEQSWKTYFLRQVRGRFDESRLHFLGLVAHDNHLRLLRRSDCHVFLTYPFVVSWSLREALACGCAVVASDTAPVREFIRPGWNGVLTPFFDHDALADRILEVLGDRGRAATLRANARAYAEEHLSIKRTLTTYISAINRLTGRERLRVVG